MSNSEKKVEELNIDAGMFEENASVNGGDFNPIIDMEINFESVKSGFNSTQHEVLIKGYNADAHSTVRTALRKMASSNPSQDEIKAKLATFSQVKDKLAYLLGLNRATFTNGILIGGKVKSRTYRWNAIPKAYVTK